VTIFNTLLTNSYKIPGNKPPAGQLVQVTRHAPVPAASQPAASLTGSLSAPPALPAPVLGSPPAQPATPTNRSATYPVAGRPSVIITPNSGSQPLSGETSAEAGRAAGNPLCHTVPPTSGRRTRLRLNLTIAHEVGPQPPAMSGAHPEAEAVSSGRVLKTDAAGMNGGESAANSDAVAANNNNEEEEEGGAQVSSALLPANGTAHAQVSIWDLIHWWASKLFLKSANRKSTNSWAHSTIANPQISYVWQSAYGKSVNCHDKSASRKFAKVVF
jgi:hypothetical protein